ncbi:MAG: hypothetical protein ABL959_09405 [Pyrinomonadaceae bacterium]
MNALDKPNFLTKLRWSLPWLSRYPQARLRALAERTAFEKKHVIITVANHFEPGWKKEGGFLDLKTQIKRMKEYHALARSTGEAVLDADGTKFRHTNFYPAEQYHPEILEIMAEMQAEGLGEVEVHMHHEGDGPDTPENTRRVIETFRDTIADRHKCLSRMDGRDTPMYAFVHGNLALANSWGGKYCGVDNEMEILRDTGCYVDMTLPSAPDKSQVPVINQIYECALPMHEAVPHRKGKRVAVNGKESLLPLIFTGPLVLYWNQRNAGLPLPRIDDGALTANQPLNASRLRRWQSANVTVAERSDWIFVKLYCHGFFDYDQSACIGEEARRFFGDAVEESEKSDKFKVHFASAREAFNMVTAAINGEKGEPGKFRDYKLRSIMNNNGVQRGASFAWLSLDYIFNFCIFA